MLLVLRAARRRRAHALGSLVARLVEILFAEEQVLRAGLAVDAQPARLGALDLVHGFLGGDVHQQHRYVQKLGERDGAVGGLAFHDEGPRRGVEPGGRQALELESLGEPCDAVGILGMDHQHGLLAPRRGQRIEHLAVRELEVVVGHVDLEGGIAVGHQRRKILAHHLGIGIGDDDVEGVVDQRLALGPLVVAVDRVAQRLAAALVGEGDDGRWCRRPRRPGCRSRSRRRTASRRRCPGRNGHGRRCRPGRRSGRWRRSPCRPCRGARPAPPRGRPIRRCRPARHPRPWRWWCCDYQVVFGHVLPPAAVGCKSHAASLPRPRGRAGPHSAQRKREPS